MPSLTKINEKNRRPRPLFLSRILGAIDETDLDNLNGVDWFGKGCINPYKIFTP